jgi:hypothetical protein
MDESESITTVHQPEPQVGDRIRWAETLQFTARLGAIVLVAAYGCGFLTLLIYHSAFKIADFGLMQPRILAAGFLFLLFLMLPVLTISRMYSLFGLTKLTGREITASEENKGTVKLLLGIQFFAAAYGLSLFCRALIEADPEPPHSSWQEVLSVVSFLLLLTSIALTPKRIDKAPGKIVLFSLFANILFAILLFQTDSRSFFWMTVWFYACGIGFLLVQSAIREKKQLLSQEWERHFLIFLVVLVPLFARIYSGIRREYGGGRPVPAVMYFSQPPQFIKKNCANVFLVEDTDAGYYALDRSHGDESFYVRRDQVGAIRFTKEKDSGCS